MVTHRPQTDFGDARSSRIIRRRKWRPCVERGDRFDQMICQSYRPTQDPTWLPKDTERSTCQAIQTIAQESCPTIQAVDSTIEGCAASFPPL